MTILKYKTLVLFITLSLITGSCGKDYLVIEPKGTKLESTFYKTESEIFEGLVATYDPMQWGGLGSFGMKLGILNAASDDCYAGGSDASDQPVWVASDAFTIDPNLGPQRFQWNRCYAGIYRANLFLEKIEGKIPDLTAEKKARYIAEAKTLRAIYYFDLVRWFGNVPLITKTLGADEIYTQTQKPAADIYAQIEKDLKEAIATAQLPNTVSPDELGRMVKPIARAVLGKAILFQNNTARMAEAATQFENIINSGLFRLEKNYADIFKPSNKFGAESILEIVHSNVARYGWESFGGNLGEGNYNVQFFGMRDFVGPLYSSGWSFCPVTETLEAAMKGDPRYDATIVNGKELKAKGASYTAAYQNTDFFIKKYAPLASEKAADGEPALNWGYNIKEIRLADVLLMAAEAIVKSGGNEATARGYLNQVRKRVGLADRTSSGPALLDDIYTERRLELATEGHRFWDLVRTGKAPSTLKNFKAGKHELLPVPQQEIDITQGVLKQNPGY